MGKRKAFLPIMQGYSLMRVYHVLLGFYSESLRSRASVGVENLIFITDKWGNFR